MPIPKEILAVERPKSTVVKFRLGRYLVVKRTSKRVNGKAKPVDLGTIGEIIDGKYVEIRPEPKKQKRQNTAGTPLKWWTVITAASIKYW